MTVRNTKRAIFLDRDGTISPDEFGYIKDPSLYHLYPEAGEALRIMRDLGYLLFIVTNQSGIARGYFGLEELEKVHDRMRELVAAEGVILDAVYFSPYFATGIVEPYNVHHEDRKPGIGMYKRALREFHFDPAQSFMIGDRATDVQFAQNVGLRSILLLSGNGNKEMQAILQSDPEAVRPDYICENILTAAQMIKRFYP